MMYRDSAPRRKYWPILLLLLALSFLCLAYPLYVIQPFRYQGPHELAVALAVLRVRPLITLICSAAAIVVFVSYARARGNRLATWGFALCATLVCVFTALCRVNLYEKLFYPNLRPAFAAASAVKLDNDEKVIAIEVGNEARAYPIRSISYHHVINDVVAREPIVATY